MRKTIEPTYIRAQSIEIGDTINVVFRDVKGVQVSRLGTVATRDQERYDTVLYTAEGGELLRYSPSFHPLRITLLNRVERPQDLLELFRQ